MKYTLDDFKYDVKHYSQKPFTWIRWKWHCLQRAIKWFPITFNTPDYDSGYALEFFMLKLAEVRKTIDKNRHHVGDEQRVRRMWEFEQILKRILEDDNAVQYDMQYYKDGGHWDLTCEEPNKYGLVPIHITAPPLKECVMLKTDLQRFQHSQMLREQDWDLMCLYLKKYYSGWWD